MLVLVMRHTKAHPPTCARPLCPVPPPFSQVDPQPLAVLGPTAKLRRVLQPDKGLTNTAKQAVEALSQVCVCV
jgi:hypothetical protein